MSKSDSPPDSLKGCNEQYCLAVFVIQPSRPSINRYLNEWLIKALTKKNAVHNVILLNIVFTKLYFNIFVFRKSRKTYTILNCIIHLYKYILMILYK